jgi:hypothetical protein
MPGVVRNLNPGIAFEQQHIPCEGDAELWVHDRMGALQTAICHLNIKLGIHSHTLKDSAQRTARDACRTSNTRCLSRIIGPHAAQHIGKQAGDDFPRKLLLLGGTASRPQLLPPIVISKDAGERLGQ